MNDSLESISIDHKVLGFCLKHDFFNKVKNILEEEEEIIKQSTYKDLFTIESDKLFMISNNLIKDRKTNFN